MLRALCLLLGLILIPACGEAPPSPGEVEIEQDAGASGETDTPAKRLPQALQAEIDILAVQTSLAARMRHDALLRIQKGDVEVEELEVHFMYTGNVERADRDFPGHLFAGYGDYVRAFEAPVVEHLEKATGLKAKVYQVSISDLRVARAPCVTIAYSGSELGTVETPEGELPKLSFAVSLMGTFTQDLGNAVKHEIEFFTIDDEPQWIEGQSPRRLVCEQPIGRAQARVKEWMGEIALVTPK